MKLYKNFKETNAIKLNFAAEAISGGSLLAIRGTDFVSFYDWGSGQVRLDPLATRQHLPQHLGSVCVLTATACMCQQCQK